MTDMKSTYIIVEGVGLKVIRKSLNIFKEDYILDLNGLQSFDLKIYSISQLKSRIQFEGRFRFEDFYSLLMALYLDFYKDPGINVYGYSNTSELSGIKAETALFRFCEINGGMTCVACDEAGNCYRETTNPKKKLVYNYEDAEGVCSYIHPSDHAGTLTLELKIDKNRKENERSCIMVIVHYAILFMLIVFASYAERTKETLLIASAAAVVCAAITGFIYKSKNPDAKFKIVKKWIFSIGLIVFLSTLSLIALIQKSA